GRRGPAGRFRSRQRAGNLWRSFPDGAEADDPRGQLRYPAELIERDAEQERAEECGAKADAGIQPDRRPPVLGSDDCEEPEVRFEKLPCTMKPAITEESEHGDVRQHRGEA